MHHAQVSCLFKSQMREIHYFHHQHSPVCENRKSHSSLFFKYIFLYIRSVVNKTLNITQVVHSSARKKAEKIYLFIRCITN